MRNLKKVLALVLALVMALSLVTVSGAAFTDTDDVTAVYDEAVEVLTGLKVFQGRTETEFAPKATIKRGEVAAIVYRIATADTEDKQVSIYTGTSPFADVKGHWSDPYVSYCWNAGYIVGENGNFVPERLVTGYEALAMILRAVGYDKNKEFQNNANWRLNVASIAREGGALADVTEGELMGPASRELVAHLLFQAATKMPMVTWTSALSYNKWDKVLDANAALNPTLAWKNFGLTKTGYITVDDWGRPGYYWYKESLKAANANMLVGAAEYTEYVDTVVATIECEPTVTYTKEVRECDVAADLGYGASVENQGKKFELFVNGDDMVTNSYRIEATDTLTKVGGNGRLVEVYYNYNKANTHRVVMIDTFLAKVTAKSDAKYDAGSHLEVPATLTVNLFDGPVGSTGGAQAGYTIPNVPGTTNWDEYEVDDLILVNAYTAKTVGLNAEISAYTTYPVKTAAAEKHAEVTGKADATLTGKQTAVARYTNTHTVEGTDYDDAKTLFLDQASTDSYNTYCWVRDSYGYVIGIVSTVPSGYGVITGIWSTGANDTGKGSVKATVKLSSGDTVTKDLSSIIAIGKAADGTRTTTDVTPGTDMMVAGATAGTLVKLTPVYDSAAKMPMDLDGALTANTSGDYQYSGNVNVAITSSRNTSYITEKNATPGDATNAAYDLYNILAVKNQLGNLYKFVDGVNGTTATEVAGIGTGTTPGTNCNSTAYAGLNFDLVDTATVFEKGDSILTYDTANAKSILTDSKTQFIVQLRDGATLTGTIKTFTGSANMPGAKLTAADGEIDWVDANSDGIADVVYCAATIEGTITYDLFYYNGGKASFDTAVGGTGYITGSLNGEEQTAVEIDNYTLYSEIYNSFSAVDTYPGHLFAVKRENGVIKSAGQLASHATNATPTWYNYHGVKSQFLTAPDTAGRVTLTNGNIGGTAGEVWRTLETSAFLVDNGANTGYNKYTANTTVAYFNGGMGTFSKAGNVFTVYESNGTTKKEFVLSGDAKVIGDWNKAAYSYITVVYEAGAAMGVATQVYITPWTITPTPVTPAAAAVGTVLTTGIEQNPVLLANELSKIGTGGSAAAAEMIRNNSDLLVDTSVDNLIKVSGKAYHIDNTGAQAVKTWFNNGLDANDYVIPFTFVVPTGAKSVRLTRYEAGTAAPSTTAKAPKTENDLTAGTTWIIEQQINYDDAGEWNSGAKLIFAYKLEWSKKATFSAAAADMVGTSYITVDLTGVTLG